MDIAHGMRVTTVLVNVIPQGNRLIATSRDVPGLHVWADDQDQLCERVIQAVKILFKANKKIDVEVLPESRPDEFPEPPRACSKFVVAHTPA